MEDWKIGLWLMFGAVTVMGIVFGFRISRNNGEYPITAMCITAFFYYWGALVFAPTAMERASSSFMYAFATVFMGVLATTIATFLWYCFFEQFNKFVRWYSKVVLNSE